MLGANEPAESGALFRAPRANTRAGEVVRDGQPRNAAADDDDVDLVVREDMSSGYAGVMDEPGERLHVLDRRAWEDAVAEIEDVSRPAGCAAQDVFGRAVRPVQRPEEQRWIEVPWIAAIVAERLPGLDRVGCASRRR